MQYRPEIDGLRAIAVLPVIFFHAGFPWFSGGYVGVDIFFVISGYLITTILLTEMENNDFSLVRFYERRARRILPALFFVIIITTVFATFVLTPTYLEDFSRSLIAIVLFSSNFLFWQESGYWGIENDLKPMLHTWSLAVEEQYYLLFPLFLMVMWKYKKHLILISMLIITVSSVALSYYLTSVRPVASFFLIPTRGWELAIGSLTAWYTLYRKNQLSSITANRKVANFSALLGAVLIGLSVALFDENTPFPGVFAALPTIGTALIIIFARKTNFAGYLLGTKPLVGIGLISYSAYLWHQPIFAFARHISLFPPSKVTFFLLSLLALFLAALTWKYIEGPFRDKKFISRRSIFRLYILCSIAVVSVSLFFLMNDGLAGRFSPAFNLYQVAQLENMLDPEKTKSKEINYDTTYGSLKIGVFDKEKRLEESTFLVWGDSHAKSLSPAIRKSALQNQVQGVIAERGGCIPLLETAQILPQFYETCKKQNRMVFEYISNNKNIKKVFLISRWALYAEGKRFKNEQGHTIFIKDDASASISIDGNKEVFTRALTSTVQKLKEIGVEVVVVKQVPEVEFNVPQAKSKTLIFGYDVDLRPLFHDYIQRNSFVNEKFDEMKEQFGVSLIEPHLKICSGERCSIQDAKGNPIYRDTNHIMPHFATDLSEIFDESLKQ